MFLIWRFSLFSFLRRKKNDVSSSDVISESDSDDLDQILKSSLSESEESLPDLSGAKKIEAILADNKAIEGYRGVGFEKAVAYYLNQMRNFESDRIESVKRERKNAWYVAGGASVIALLTMIGFVSILPLKSFSPYVLRVDNNTGQVDIVNPMEDAKDTYEERVNRFFIQSFVQLRESYHWASLKKNVEDISLLSTDSVFNQYQSYLYGANSPMNMFKNNLSVKVDITGTTFFDADGKVFAQTRFTKQVIDNAGLRVDAYPVTYWMATSTFDYKKEIKRAKEEKVNPLGFQITSYNVDQVTQAKE